MMQVVPGVGVYVPLIVSPRNAIRLPVPELTTPPPHAAYVGPPLLIEMIPAPVKHVVVGGAEKGPLMVRVLPLFTVITAPFTG
jgi:hypothetical protein